MRNTHQTVLAVVAIASVLAAGCRTVPSSARTDGGESGFTGKVVLKDTGDPVAGAHVYAYSDYTMNLIGVADHVSKGSGEDGSYTLLLPPGEYHLVSRKRASGANYGPIVTGDLYDHRFEREAVSVLPGQLVNKDFALVALSEPLFFQVFTEAQRQSSIGIRGRLLDAEGQPVQGAFATAYRDANMKRLPDFASTLTDDEGRFTLYLPEGGKWYIGARSHARGVPKAGEPVGRYEGSADHSIMVSPDGFVEGIEIVLKPFESEVPEGYTPY